MKRQSIVCAALFLVACTGGDVDIVETRSAQSGMRVTAEAVQRSETHKPPLSAAIAGMLAGSIMSQRVAEDVLPIPLDEDSGDTIGTRADTELLGILVKLLDTDVQNLLNAAQNREDALQAYIDSLSSHAQRGHIRLRAMQDDAERSTDEKKRAESRIRELRSEIGDAIGGGETNRVSALTDELILKQKALGEAEADIIVKEFLASAYEDVLTPIGERLDAMNANRDALVKGVRVIEMPGVEELKILEYKGGKIRVGTRRSFF